MSAHVNMEFNPPTATRLVRSWVMSRKDSGNKSVLVFALAGPAVRKQQTEVCCSFESEGILAHYFAPRAFLRSVAESVSASFAWGTIAPIPKNSWVTPLKLR